MPEKNQPDYQKSILQSEAEEKSKRMVSSMCPLKMKGNLQEEEQSKKHNTKIAVSLIGKEEIEKRLKELKETPDKTFDQHVIAYIDFLGSKERMKKEDSYDSLHLLQILLEGIKKKASFITNINFIDEFSTKIFSDNMVIAQKIKEESLSDQIISMINLLSLLQFEAFFQFGFSLRGGITIGELYIDDSVVWGTGLIDAYQIENNLANYPRVIVSQSVIDAYEKCQEKSINIFAMIKQDKDGYWFVDFLTAAPNITLIPQISASLVQKAYMCVEKDDRVKQKINWVISYFNSYCHQFADRGDYEQYTVPYI